MPKWKSWRWLEARATLQNAVPVTDQQIAALVYELYGLAPKEIALVEGAEKP